MKPPELGRLRRMVRDLRRVLGMPDYAAYCSHMQNAHPERELPSEREYFNEYLKGRYDSGPTRCC